MHFFEYSVLSLCTMFYFVNFCCVLCFASSQFAWHVHPKFVITYVVVIVQEQYIFVYDAILEALKCGDTSVPCTELRQKYAKLLKVNPESGKTYCQEEYEVNCHQRCF